MSQRGGAVTTEQLPSFSGDAIRNRHHKAPPVGGKRTTLAKRCIVIVKNNTYFCAYFGKLNLAMVYTFQIVNFLVLFFPGYFWFAHGNGDKALRGIYGTNFNEVCCI